MSQQVNDINSPSTKPLLVEEIELLVPKEPLRSLSPSPPTSCTHNTEQVLLLQAIHDQLASQNTPLQFIGNAVLQTVFVTIAFLFGLYSIFSWHASITANVSAQQANQIALISLCLFNNNTSTTEFCSRILGQAAEALSYLASSNLGSSSIEGTANVWPWPVASQISPQIYYWIGAPVIAGALGAYGSWFIYRERSKSAGTSA